MPFASFQPHWLMAACTVMALCLIALHDGGAQTQHSASWSSTTPMPTARSEIAAAESEGIIYVAGGLTLLGTSDAFESHDPGDGTWSALAPLPQSLNHLALASANGLVYATGGYRSVTMRPDVKGVWRYTPSSNQWAQVADMPGPRGAHAMVAQGGKLYVVGGAGDRARELWAYDPAGDTWDTTLAPMLTEREHLAAVGMNGKLYVMGGRDANHHNLAALEIYDIRSNRWERGAPMANARSGFTAGVLGGRVHVAGGESIEFSQTMASHEVFDPSTGRWSSAPPMPETRHGLASAVQQERWYLIGGAGSATLLTLFTASDRVHVYGK